ncbi:hypothetical protein QFC22_001323 [Naganishia vaughanmartiniae]|uniref:Uncharacterized protein n=1 Tax=Naganishia vaughanmartiniae TaxID=1424756 RepID=A0ACC2XIN5_9TREE|nr:hypothetical protein QFC22_001323 [Naganishia vaughanmartiniae]
MAAENNNLPHDNALNESTSSETNQGRRGKRKAVGDASNLVEEKPDIKRLRSVEQSGHGVEGGNVATAAGMENIEDTVNQRRHANDFVKTLMKALNSAKDDTGRLMSSEFKHLPDTQLFADYYEIIRAPVSLEVIRSKNSHFDKFIKQYDKTKDTAARQRLVSQSYEGYADWRAAEHDFDMIWRNAKRYNQKGALIYEDAQKLHKLTKTMSEDFARKLSGEEVQNDNFPPAIPPSTIILAAKTTVAVPKVIKQGMKVIEATRSLKGNRSATEFFHELPDRDEYADYYLFITKPISLAEIRDKVQQRTYTDISQWKDDVTLMCDNAMQYNIEGSTVYDDAVAIKSELQKFLQAHQDNSQRGTTDQPGSTSTPTPAPGPSVPKIKLNISGLKDARASSQASRPVKEKPEKPPRQKKPALPEKVVTKEIVASLPQYDEAEKSAWAATLNAKQTKQLLQWMKEGPEAAATAKQSEHVTSEPKIPAAVKPSTLVPPIAATTPAVTVAPSPSQTEIVKPQAPVEGAQSNAVPAVPVSGTTAIPTSILTPTQPVATLPAQTASILTPTQPVATLPAQTASIPTIKEKPATLPPKVDETQTKTPTANSAVIQTTTENGKDHSGTRRPSSLYSSFSIPAPIPRPKAVPLTHVPKRPPPSMPLVRHLQFVYDLKARRPDAPVQTEWQNMLRLKNMRGITSHIVAITADTRNIEITALLEEGYHNLNPLHLNSHMEPIGHKEEAHIAETLSYAPLPELSLQCNGKTPKGELIHPGGDVTKRPVAHKWSFSVDPNIANFVVEIYAQRPAEKVEGGRKEVKETCMIFVNRQ